MRIALILILLPFLIQGQKSQKHETYGIKNPGRTFNKCADYLTIYKRLPAEARYTIVERDGYLYFTFPSQVYYDLIFDKRKDGIAVDIVHRDQYRCYDKNNFANSWAHRGTLLPPIYKADMLKNKSSALSGYVVVKYAPVPENYDPINSECNLIILQKKYLCGYHSFSNLELESWKLLKTGMYMDTLTTEDRNELHRSISKTLRFTIPFEKNKGKFDQADIQPLYDSLRLTDYNIKEITIKAYTSVEGSTKRNLTLQEQRSKSIIQALQGYQRPEIISHIHVNENWVEFLNDIPGTSLEYLSRLSKEAIKNELTKKELSESAERILKDHRKALVELKLQKKFSQQENDPEILKNYFDQHIAQENIDEAIYLQEIIFEKIQTGALSPDFIDELAVPESDQYGPILNNFAVFRSQQADINLYEHILHFEKLLNLLPDNPKILYNLTALKMKAWTQGELLTNKDELKKTIDQLKKLKVPDHLIKRLEANYYIILTDYYEFKQDYKNKIKALKQVYWLYTRLSLDDHDLLSLAKYLSYYSRFEWAENILEKRINRMDVDEDLIYYYIKLTINDRKKTRQEKYRAFMLNAIDKNQQRFCDLFLPKPQGGYTFQLLDDEYLRKTYCENCFEDNE